MSARTRNARAATHMAHRKLSTIRALINTQNGLILLLAVLLSSFQTNAAIGEQKRVPRKSLSTQALLAKPADWSSASSRETVKRADLWSPPDTDREIPQVTAEPACSLSDVLSEAGKKVEELVHNVDEFTAKEVIEHQTVNRSGQLGRPEIRKFNYLVSYAKTPEGLNVKEYRDGNLPQSNFQITLPP